MGIYHLNDSFLKKTIEVWQPHSREKLTEDDAREIIRNISGLFDTLASWDKKSKDSEENKKDDAEPDRDT